VVRGGDASVSLALPNKMIVLIKNGEFPAAEAKMAVLLNLSD